MRIHTLLVQTFLSAMCVTMAFAQMAPFSARDPRYLLQPSDVLEIHYGYSPEFDQTVTILTCQDRLTGAERILQTHL